MASGGKTLASIILVVILIVVFGSNAIYYRTLYNNLISNPTITPPVSTGLLNFMYTIDLLFAVVFLGYLGYLLYNFSQPSDIVDSPLMNTTTLILISVLAPCIIGNIAVNSVINYYYPGQYSDLLPDPSSYYYFSFIYTILSIILLGYTIYNYTGKEASEIGFTKNRSFVTLSDFFKKDESSPEETNVRKKLNPKSFRVEAAPLKVKENPRMLLPI